MNCAQFWREFRAFFLSWAVMRTKQPSHFRTDLLVFAAEERLRLLFEMGCSKERRKYDKERDRCIAITHVPLKVSPECHECIVHVLGDWSGCRTGNREMGRMGSTGQCS